MPPVLVKTLITLAQDQGAQEATTNANPPRKVAVAKSKKTSGLDFVKVVQDSESSGTNRSPAFTASLPSSHIAPARELFSVNHNNNQLQRSAFAAEITSQSTFKSIGQPSLDQDPSPKANEAIGGNQVTTRRLSEIGTTQ
ncbi:hypothetical protein HDU76_009617, partial [Blyttiomyces sp. JEL0837]